MAHIQHLYPVEYFDGGWTVAFRDEDGTEVNCRGSYYCSASGTDGRAYAQEYADRRNAEMANIAAEDNAPPMTNQELAAQRKIDAGELRPGMRRYRFPTSILWEDDGYRVIQASCADAAMNYYRTHYAASAQHVSLANLQIESGRKWQFASEVAAYLGGYRRGV